MRFLLTILALFFLVDATAQLGKGGVLTIKGRVTDAGTGEPIESVTIVNTSTQALTYTDKRGAYNIQCESGQSIVATFLGYKAITIAISSGSELIPINFSLRRESYKMDEFIVRPNYTPYQMDSAARFSTYKRTLIRGHEGSLGSPVTWLAEKISGKSQQRFRFQKNYAALEKDRFIETRYSAEMVNQMTYLTGDTLAHFMNLYPIPYDYVRTASDLELKMWIRTNFRDWKAKGMKMPVITADTSLTQNR